ncbi:hypothetical protein [Nocardioides convexus]|uniref:hypothetical protein n=1 Tax=Nocardioides convexus TaxID=2712224 RepID=UPI0024185BFE|nr:hypothetical protein [Nocardioides convexus]
MTDENTFYSGAEPIPVVVWGTGNMGRAAIRAVAAHPGLALTAVIVNDPAKAGRDAGDLAGLGGDTGISATTDVHAALGALAGGGAVAYTASGEPSPRRRCRRHRAGAGRRRGRGDPVGLRALRPPQCPGRACATRSSRPAGRGARPSS